MKKFVTTMSKARNKVIGAVTAFNLGLMSASVNAIDKVTVQSPSSTSNPFDKMGNMIGLLLTVTRYVGIALMIWGVYEFVMGITAEGQAEKRPKVSSGYSPVYLWLLLSGFLVLTFLVFLHNNREKQISGGAIFRRFNTIKEK